MAAQRKTNTVRIVAGTLRGRVLQYPQERVLRPTMARTREALFSSIEAEVHGCPFLDLFAGAGAIGIEALSRGASTVQFVERDPEIANLITHNLAQCSIEPSRYRVHVVEVGAFLGAHLLDGIDNFVVFADPPYDGPDATNVLELFERRAYSGLKLLVIEHGTPLDDVQLRHLHPTRSKRYGDAQLSFFVSTGDER